MLSHRDDDDINDVATMGGVNLSEESRNILATNSELMSGQLRSCQDVSFLSTQPLLARINERGEWYSFTLWLMMYKIAQISPTVFTCRV